MNNIVAYIKEKLNSNFIENIVKNNDLSGLESDIKRFSEEICLKAYKSFLEDYDKILKLDENRDAKYVVQRLVSKNLITTLGTMNLIRTKYYDKADKRYFCLLDEKLNLPQYERFTPLSFAKILDEATNTTYERAGKNINSSDIISKGTIYNKIRRLNVEENYIEQPVKKKVKYLYINLDEDHISLQKQIDKKLQGKIGYVYEGVYRECKNRYRLINKHTICGTYLKSSGNKAFYEKITDYIKSVYDLDFIDKIIIYGDGANWIKASTDYIPKSEFRIDKFHLNKYLLNASYTLKGNRFKLKKYALRSIYENDINKFRNVMVNAIPCSSNTKLILDAINYIVNNWDAIQLTITSTDGSGCSAEGNVSHTLSARMSQKGLGWSEHNADQICRLRGIQSNHGQEIFINISNEYFNKLNNINKDYYEEPIKYIHKEKFKDIKDMRYIERMQVTISPQLSKKMAILGTDLHLN